MNGMAIMTEGLSKYYGRHRGIERIDLAVPEGEIFGFIGPNGAGKTTTIRTLLNLIFPTAGRAEIFGKDVVRHGPEIRRSIGYVPAEVKYYPGMRVKELLAYSAALNGAPDLSRAAAIAERLALDTDRRIDELSSGNAKKVALVQSMLHSPRLLILDEPTNGLDPLIQNRLSELLQGGKRARRDGVLLQPRPRGGAAALPARGHHQGGDDPHERGRGGAAAEAAPQGLLHRRAAPRADGLPLGNGAGAHP